MNLHSNLIKQKTFNCHNSNTEEIDKKINKWLSGANVRIFQRKIIFDPNLSSVIITFLYSEEKNYI